KFLFAIARLKDGATMTQAAEQLKAATTRLAQEYPDSYRGARVEVVPRSEFRRKNERSILVLSFAAGCLLLLIACANAASLIMSRGVFRKAEVSIRSALGARRIRVVRQFMTEGL